MNKISIKRLVVASLLTSVMGVSLVAPLSHARDDSRGSYRYVSQSDEDRNWNNPDWRSQKWDDNNWRNNNWRNWNDDNWRNHNWGHYNWHNISEREARRIAQNLFYPRKHVSYVTSYGHGYDKVYRVFFTDGTRVDIRARDGRIINVRLEWQWQWRSYQWQ